MRALSRMQFSLVVTLVLLPHLAFAFGSTAVLDDFNRADGALGSGWTAAVDAQHVGAPVISTNTAKGTTNGGLNEAYWNASTMGPASEAYLTLGGTANGEDMMVYCRVTSPGASSNGYAVLYRPSGPFMRVRRIDSGAFTSLGADTTITALGDGDKIGIECNGSSITAYKYTSATWSSVVSVTDSTYSAAGYIGMAIGDSGSNAATGDDFGGGTLSSGVSTQYFRLRVQP